MGQYWHYVLQIEEMLLSEGSEGTESRNTEELGEDGDGGEIAVEVGTLLEPKAVQMHALC